MNKFLSGLSDNILGVIDWKAGLAPGPTLILYMISINSGAICVIGHQAAMDRETGMYASGNNAFMGVF